MSVKPQQGTISDKELLQVLQDNYDKLFSAEKKVADYVLSYPQDVVNLNVSQLAKKSGVSDATIVRMCHRIGCTGYYQFRIILAGNLGKKQYENKVMEKKIAVAQNQDAVEKLFSVYASKIMAIGKKIDISTMQECVKLIKNCSQVHIIAVGNTCPLAQYMGFRLGRLGVRCTYNVGAEYFFNHINLAEKDDIVIAISQSGVSKQVIQGVELAIKKELKVIAITAYEQSPLSSLADYVLLSDGDSSAETFDYYKCYAHLNETAVIDALLDFVMNEEIIKTKEADIPELILSEYKI